MPAGRPSKYDEVETLNQSIEYLTKVWREKGHKVPTIAGLARHLDIRRETVHAWSKDPDKDQFSNIVEALMAEQEIELVNGGLSAEMNATISKLLLSKHEYAETTRNLNANLDLSGKSDDELEDIIKSELS